MDSQHQSFSEKTAFSSDPQQGRKDGSTCMDKEEIIRIVKRTAANLHSAASFDTSNTFNLVHSSNNPEAHKELDRILASHFYSLNLANPQSVIVFLLLSCFLLKKENKEIEVVRKLYEDHISLLKDKNSELEEKVMKQSSGTSKDRSEPSPLSQSCVSCDEVRDRLDAQVTQLQQSYDEVCHINSQWALDYETLSKQIKNATGFHSVSTSSTSSSLSSSNESTSMHTSPLIISGSSCMHCSLYESQLEDRSQEIEILTAELVGLREDVKDFKERISLKQQEFSCMEREYQVLRLQVQDIGDLQQALNMKHEYRKMHYSLQQKAKLYQDAMGEKMNLQKQVEKLRQTFLKCFPVAMPIQAPPTSISTRPPMGGSGNYSSFPLLSCRHNIQSTILDSTPPTPPGLLARGDMRGGNVEKDDQLVPHIRLEHDAKARRKSYKCNNAIHSRSLNHLDTISGQLHVSSSSHSHHATKTRLKSTSLSPSAIQPLDFVSTENTAAIAPTRENLSSNSSNEITYQSQVAHSHSGNSASHAGSYHRSLVPTYSTVSNSSNPDPYSNVSVSFGASASMPSIGYASNSLTSVDPHAMSHTHKHTPYVSCSPRNIGIPVEELEPLTQEFSEQETSRALSGSSYSRPSSLSLVATSSVESATMSTKLHHQQQQQFFYCPNCKKSFSCVGQDSFDSWFEHVKSCNS